MARDIVGLERVPGAANGVATLNANGNLPRDQGALFNEDYVALPLGFVNTGSQVTTGSLYSMPSLVMATGQSFGTNLVSGGVVLPKAWQTYTTRILWAHGTASSGDVVLRSGLYGNSIGVGDGSDLDISPAYDTQTITAAADGIVKVTTSALTRDCPTHGKLARLRWERRGTVGEGDTLGQDIHVLAIQAVRVS